MKPPLTIANPCPKKWTELTGDSVHRHCSECNLQVHNLSEMSPGQQREFVATAGQSCIAYETDARGNFLSKRRFGWLTPILNFPRAIAISLLASLLPFLFSSCARATLGRGSVKSPASATRVSLGYTSGPDSLKK